MGVLRLKVVIAFMCVAMGLYFVLLGQMGIALVQSGKPAAVGMGIGVLILPFIGAWVTWSTLRAGFKHQHLARRIHDEGLELDVTDLPKMPSGRVERTAADALFEQVKAEWEADPDNWRNNYRLARAYDYAGDRRRARDIMRRAVALEERERSHETH